jgi:hypothetical protein
MDSDRYEADEDSQHRFQGIQSKEVSYKQCCGSGIRCFFDTWIRDVKIRIRYKDPRSATLLTNIDHLRKKKLLNGCRRRFQYSQVFSQKQVKSIKSVVDRKPAKKISAHKQKIVRI